MIFKIHVCFFKWGITFIVKISWNIWNFKHLDHFWKKALENENIHNDWNGFVPLIQIFSCRENLFKNIKTIIFQKAQLSVTF